MLDSRNMRYHLLLVLVVAVITPSEQKGSKRSQISGSRGADPYGTIGAVLPPVPGAPLQGSVSQDGVLPGESGHLNFDVNSRYEIPNYAGLTHQTAPHSDTLQLDSHSIHLSAHPIPFSSHKEYYSDLCHEGYDDFCYSPYGSNYGAINDAHYLQDPHGHWGDIHYDTDSLPHFVGNVLSSSDALRLGFDQSYLKKLGFDGKVWHHSHNFGTHHLHTGGHGWTVGHAAHGVCHRSIDIAFVVDGSTEKSDFAKFIDFIAAVIGKLPISEFGSRVALLTFGDKGELKFGFDKYLTNMAVSHALLDVKEKYKKKDGRKLGDALKIAKTDLFDVSGRDEKQKILVVLSDGAAGDSFNEYSQALKDMAVAIYFVGPKANLKTEQVNSLVSEKDEWFSFITDDYEKMIRDVAPVFPPIGCNVDVVFVIDCTKGDDTKLNEIKAFIKHSISGLSIGTRGDHVSVVTYGGKSEVKFNLNKKSHPVQVYAALQEFECGKGGSADGAPALGLVKDVFEKSGHQGSINVTVYVSGSKTASSVAEPAKTLRNMGVRLYGVGYGKDVNEDDMKKIASLPSDYFVHSKEDEKKMEAMVGNVLMHHLAELKGVGSHGSAVGGHGWLHHPAAGVGGIGGIGGIGGYGGWGGLFMRSGVEPSYYEEDDLDNLQDDTAKVLKDIANQGADQDGFTSSLGPKAPLISAGVEEKAAPDYDKDDLEESLKEENGVNRASIENKSLSVPTFDALHGDSLIPRKAHGKDYANKKRTVASKRGKKNSFRRKSHKKAAIHRNSIESTVGSKNEAAGKNESETSVKGDNETAAVNETAKDAGSEFTGLGNATDGQNLTDAGNATLSTRGKMDPYASIGSDLSSTETASNINTNIGKESESEAAQVRSHAPAQHKEKDLLDMAKEYQEKSTKEVETAFSKMKEGVAVKKHMTKEEMKSLESPVHALVKSIFHRAAKNVMKDFTKSNGLQNIAKMLVKAAVHNAMLGRPSAEKALEVAEKVKKKQKKNEKKKKSKKANTRSLKKKLDAAKLVKDDLMAIGRQKITKTEGKVKGKKEKKTKSSVVNEE